MIHRAQFKLSKELEGNLKHCSDQEFKEYIADGVKKRLFREMAPSMDVQDISKDCTDGNVVTTLESCMHSFTVEEIKEIVALLKLLEYDKKYVPKGSIINRIKTILLR